jgi:UDP:flavonoid glycosyltransferase YjiC (YdhE family)
LASVGSLGDLHPVIGLGRALKALGASPILAVRQDHLPAVRDAGLEGHAIFDDIETLSASMNMTPAALYQQILEDDRTLIRGIVLPRLSDMTARLARIVDGTTDLIAASRQTIAAPLLAEKHGIPYVPLEFQPLMLLSPHDPPWIDGFELAWHNPGPVGRIWNIGFLWVVARVVHLIFGGPINKVRRDLGLPRSKAVPYFEQDAPAPFRLALYSLLLSRISAREKARMRFCGFPFFDGETNARDDTGDAELERFLDVKPAPLVFTLGSFSFLGKDFFRESIAAARSLGRRAVLVTYGAKDLPEVDPDQILIRDYVPYSLLFSRAAVIVHHGGVGTLGLAMRAGKPQLVASIGTDQPDNAARVVRLGIADELPLARYRADAAASAIARLLNEPGFARRAAEVAGQISQEPGPEEAARLLMQVAGSRIRKGKYA